MVYQHKSISIAGNAMNICNSLIDIRKNTINLFMCLHYIHTVLMDTLKT